jgi:hypothetical protein
MGGVGKSQTAVMYAVTHRHEYEGVFWASALSKSAFIASYNGFAETLNKSLQGWCNEPQRKRWLLIVDNLDDPTELGDPGTWLPPSRAGHVLLTTRRVLPIIGDLGCTIKIVVLEKGPAIDLLLSVSSQRKSTATDHQAAAEIVELLGRLPLAIQQSGSFISVNQDQLVDYIMPLKELLNRVEIPMNQQDDDRDIEQSWGPPNNEQSPKTVLTTWAISYQRILQTNRLAANLLCVFAFLDYADIHETVLIKDRSPQKRWEPDGELLLRAPADLGQMPFFDSKHGLAEFEKAIRVLLSYSLISRKRHTNSYYIHQVGYSAIGRNINNVDVC